METRTSGKCKLIEYLHSSPLESFREPATYWVLSNRTEFDHIYRDHRDRSGLELSKEGRELFDARFLIGYGINEIRDFLLGTVLHHYNATPGDIAEVVEIGDNFQEGLQLVGKTKNGNLLKILKEVSGVLVPLHKRMSERWKSAPYASWLKRCREHYERNKQRLEEPEEDKFAESKKIMLEEFGDDLRYAERELSKRFDVLTEMLRNYSTSTEDNYNLERRLN